MIQVYTGKNEDNVWQYAMKIKDSLNIKLGNIICSNIIDCKHPIKQIQHVQDIITQNNNVIIITYSPYVIQAFKKFGKNVEFYWVDENQAVNKSNDLNYIFKSYSAPLQEIVWLDI